jgi:hypothetical protein
MSRRHEGRVRYAVFRQDPRAQLLIVDSTGFCVVLVPATGQIREDIAAELPPFRAIREKRGMAVPDDDEHLSALTAEGRVLRLGRRMAQMYAGMPTSWPAPAAPAKS